MKRKRGYFFLFTFIWACSYAQNINVAFNLIDNERIRNIELTGIHIAAKDNKVWLTTNEKLISFDGSEFRSFSIPGKTNYRIRSIIENDKGNFYIWLDKTGLYEFNTNHEVFSPFTISKDDSIKLSKISFVKLFISKAGIVYVGAEEGGYYCIDPIKKTCLSLSLPISDLTKKFPSTKRNLNTAYSFFEDKSDPDLLWIGSDLALYCYNGKTGHTDLKSDFVYEVRKNENEIYGLRIFSIEQLNKDTLLLGTNGGGVVLFNKLKDEKSYNPPQKKYFKISNVRNYVNSIFRIDDRQLLVAFRDTLPALFSIPTSTYSFLPGIQMLPINNQTTVIKGSRYGIWMIRDGKLYFSRKQSSVFFTKDISYQFIPDIMPNLLSGIFYDEEMESFFAGISFSDGVTKFSNTIYPLDYFGFRMPGGEVWKNAEPPVWSLALWKKNIYAKGPGNYLYLLDKERKRFDSILLKMGDKDFTTIVAMLTGIVSDKFYVLSENFELIEYANIERPGKIVATFKEAEKKRTKIFNGKILESNGNIYVTETNNIYRLNKKSGKADTLRLASYDDKGNAIKKVTDFAVDEIGQIWIIDEKKKIKIFDDKLQENKNILNPEGVLFNNIEYASRGYVIVSSNQGFYIYKSPTDLFAYNIGHGLESNKVMAAFFSNKKVFLSFYNKFQMVSLDSLLMFRGLALPYLTEFQLLKSDSIVQISDTFKLKYFQNFVKLRFSVLEYEMPDQIQYSYRLKGLDSNWVITDHLNRSIVFSNLMAGDYHFQLRSKLPHTDWSSIVTYKIIITPPFWKTKWFMVLAGAFLIAFISIAYKLRVKKIRKEESEKSAYEKQLLELEAKALRAQMNPHFIFNCLNSIKSLIQEKQTEKGVTYLTTFSKLIRTLFNNADKKEITLYDEIETCKLYLQLESMRFDTKFSYQVNVDENIDLKSVQVPALIIQPFIENAIWHGIMPKNNGGTVLVNVSQNNGHIEIAIEDDGIGREASQQNKSINTAHQSKGVNLTQARLELDNLLQQRQATLVTIDKKAENRASAGTKVIITIKEEQ